MTPLCWVGYLLLADGVLVLLGRRSSDASPVRSRPRRFLWCALSSIPIWLFFDWINFSFIDAWRYHGLPADWRHRYAGYAVAFGTINPAMFLTAEIYRRISLTLNDAAHDQGDAARPSTHRDRPAIPAALLLGLSAVGVLFLAAPLLLRDPLANLTLWLGPLLLLDPLNEWLGAPSIIGDWRARRWRRTLVLMAGGLSCGLLWEFWNYWAVAKWTYHLPFLGPLEDNRYFEMPWPGLLGFLPFAVSCWAVFQSVVFAATRYARPSLAPEPLQAPDAIL